jgi:hypothetical protein
MRAHTHSHRHSNSFRVTNEDMRAGTMCARALMLPTFRPKRRDKARQSVSMWDTMSRDCTSLVSIWTLTHPLLTHCCSPPLLHCSPCTCSKKEWSLAMTMRAVRTCSYRACMSSQGDDVISIFAHVAAALWPNGCACNRARGSPWGVVITRSCNFSERVARARERDTIADFIERVFRR